MVWVLKPFGTTGKAVFLKTRISPSESRIDILENVIHLSKSLARVTEELAFASFSGCLNRRMLAFRILTPLLEPYVHVSLYAPRKHEVL